MKNLAVFIDADNIPARHAETIFKAIEELEGAPITRRAFGNPTVFSGKDGWKDPVRKFSIEARPQVNNVDGKNIADFALVIDAMDCLYSGRYDGFVIVSSDSDFTSLAIRLRNEGKAVYGFGDDRASESFKAACIKFYPLPRLEPPVTAPSVAAKAPLPKKKFTIAGKDPKEFFSIVRQLRASKAKKSTSLKAVLRNERRTNQEADQLLEEMRKRKLIHSDADGNITWCTAEQLKEAEDEIIVSALIQ